MSAYLNFGEAAWWAGAGVTVLGQLPTFDPAYNSSYSIVVIAVIGSGLLMGRIADAIVRYKKGIASLDTAKLTLCDERVQVLQLALKLRDEEIAGLKAMA